MLDVCGGGGDAIVLCLTAAVHSLSSLHRILHYITSSQSGHHMVYWPQLFYLKINELIDIGNE